MATLEKIRSKAGLLVAVVGLALFAFIIGDFLRSGSTFFNQSKEKIVIVDGQSINVQDFQKRVEEITNMYKNSNNGATVNETMQSQIRQSVFDEMVGAILLKEQSEKIGLAIGETELADLIMGNNISPVIQQIPDFTNPQTGRFDKNNLIQFLQMIESDDLSTYPVEMQQQILSAKNFWINVENGVLTQKMTDKFSNLLTSAVVTNKIDAKAAYEENAIGVDFNYVSQFYTTVSDSAVNVTNAEIEKLYALRKDGFKQDASKLIDYIAVNVVPSPADYDEVVQQLDKLKIEFENSSTVADIVNDNSDEPYSDVYRSVNQLNNDAKNLVETSSVGAVDGPHLTGDTYNLYKFVSQKQGADSVKVSQLTLPGFTDETAMKNFADSLINVIKSGKSFAEMASEATGGQSTGDMGWQTEATLAEMSEVSFMNACFDAKVNEVFTVKSSFGTHLVQVSEKTAPVTKYKVATIQVKVNPSTDTYNKLYNDLNQYISKNNTLETFKNSATEAGYTCFADVPVYETQAGLANIQNSRQVVRWAYNAKKGNVSDIFECQDYFVVAALENTVKEGIRPLNDVADVLKREIMNEKKAEKIIGDLNAKNLSSLEQYAEAMNSTPNKVEHLTFSTPRIVGIGTDPHVNAKAMLANVGEVTKPFAGVAGVYVLSVLDKRAGEQEYDEATQKQQMNIQSKYRFMSVLQNNFLLKENAKIEDNRIRFY